jgi:hypothetical protein
VDDKSDRLRLWLTFGVAAFGITVVLIAFFVSVLTLKDKDQPGQLIPAVLGAVTAAVGTLAGLVAGHTAGSAGKERAESRADAREQEAAAGRTLAESLKAEESAYATAGESGLEAFGQGERTADVDAIRRHAELARRLFP